MNREDSIVAFPLRGPALIPEGSYTLAFKRQELLLRFNRGVLELWFYVADQGLHFGIELPRYYNVSVSKGKRSFTASPHSDFSREYLQLFDRHPSFNRAPLEDFKDVYIQGLVKTIKQDYKQKKLSEVVHYSVIEQLVRTV